MIKTFSEQLARLGPVSKLTENVALGSPSDPRILLGEDVAKAGLSPENFIAVLPCDVGVLGVVNANGRLYETKKGIEAHRRFCERAKEAITEGRSVIGGESGHAEGSRTFQIPFIFIGGGFRVREDGAVVETGQCAVLNTSLGRDHLTLWRVGVDHGLSVVRWGQGKECKIEAGSEFATLNPSFVGRTVLQIEDWETEQVDWVRDPSAGTFTVPPTATLEVKEAAARLRESLEGKTMKLTWTQILENHAESAEAIRAAILAESKGSEQPPAEIDVSAMVDEKLAEALAPVRLELSEAKVANAAKDETIQALTARLDEAAAREARAELRDSVVAHLGQWKVDRRGGNAIQAAVLEEFDEGSFSTIEEVDARAGRLHKIVEASAAPVGPSRQDPEDQRAESRPVGIASALADLN